MQDGNLEYNDVMDAKKSTVEKSLWLYESFILLM